MYSQNVRRAISVAVIAFLTLFFVLTLPHLIASPLSLIDGVERLAEGGVRYAMRDVHLYIFYLVDALLLTAGLVSIHLQFRGLNRYPAIQLTWTVACQLLFAIISLTLFVIAVELTYAKQATLAVQDFVRNMFG